MLFMVMTGKLILSEKDIVELQKLKIAAIYLFGSSAEGVDSEISDIDLGILMNDPEKVSANRSTLSLYQKLYEIFSSLKSTKDHVIDIVFLQRAPLELKANVIKNGIVIYDGNPAYRADFEENTMILFADFLPIKQYFDRTVLDKI